MTFISSFKVISMGQKCLYSAFPKKHQKCIFWHFKCLQSVKKLGEMRIFSNHLCLTPYYIIFMPKKAKKWDTPLWPYPFNEWKPPLTWGSRHWLVTKSKIAHQIHWGGWEKGCEMLKHCCCSRTPYKTKLEAQFYVMMQFPPKAHKSPPLIFFS